MFSYPAIVVLFVSLQKRQWPAINRWTYPNFVVYFEKDRVIDAVAIRAGSERCGPVRMQRIHGHGGTDFASVSLVIHAVPR